MNKINVVLLSAILSGCASAPYVEPDSGPTAVLVMQSNKSDYKLLGGFSGSSVRLAVADGSGCGKLKSIEDVPEDQEQVRYKIPASESIFLNYGVTRGNSSCSVTATFVPEEGKEYLVTSVSAGACLISVSSVENGSKTQVNIEKAYVDTWSAQKACKSKSDL